MLCMLYKEIVKQLHICRYLLILTAKNTTANELQYLSNKTNKKTKKTNKSIYIKIAFPNSIERLRFLCCMTDTKIPWINS